ncbi:MAG: hypothetical protein HS127_19525 [Planctomycetia bacterium]|uniref:hypothetical protein n=1 Tax=Candidatus Kuenenia sp. TaxID=2499824 RepID=UPI001DEEFAB2|nr:hypothetical protein [Planctomycetia bacterium]MCF6153499.1 hypothetical protein [Candidatus Kuenenia stuttgartiensis]
MNIRRIFSKDTAVSIAGILGGLLVVGVIYFVPVYFFTRPKTTTEWLLNVVILAAFKVFMSPVFFVICDVYDRAYLRIFGKNRKRKQLSLWKEWAMDILVSPGASERYKIMDAIRDGYARHADKIPSEIKDINRNNAAEKIAEIAKQMDLKSIIDKRAEKQRRNTGREKKEPLRKAGMTGKGKGVKI